MNNLIIMTHIVYVSIKNVILVTESNLITNKNNITIYINKVIDELLRIRIKGDEILKDDISDIIDKSIIIPLSNEYIYNKTDDILTIFKHHIK